MRRALIIVTALTALSQLAAFFKLWLTARYFGVGNEIDGYNLALVVPTLVSGVIAGILQTGLFPVRARLAIKQTLPNVEKFERSVLWVCIGIGFLLSLIICVGAEYVAGLLANSSPAETRRVFVIVLMSCAILIFLNITNDCIGYLLAFRDRFAYSAGAPVLNGLLGGFIIIFWQDNGITALILSTLIGAAIQLAVCAAGLLSLDFQIRGEVRLEEVFKAAWSIMKAGGWIVPGVIISNITAAFPPVWAAAFGEGAVSAFSYAYRMHASAIQLLVMASSTIILAQLSDLHARGDHASIKKIIKQSAWFSLGIGASAVLVIWIFGSSVLELIFGGKFDATAARRVADIWTCLSLGLGFSLLGNVVSKLWQAQGRARLMSIMAGVSLGVAIIFQFSLKTIAGELSIPLALSLMAVINVVIGLRLLNLSPYLIKG